jgi:hypothetical protein
VRSKCIGSSLSSRILHRQTETRTSDMPGKASGYVCLFADVRRRFGDRLALVLEELLLPVTGDEGALVLQVRGGINCVSFSSCSSLAGWNWQSSGVTRVLRVTAQ